MSIIFLFKNNIQRYNVINNNINKIPLWRHNDLYLY